MLRSYPTPFHTSLPDAHIPAYVSGKCFDLTAAPNPIHLPPRRTLCDAQVVAAARHVLHDVPNPLVELVVGHQVRVTGIQSWGEEAACHTQTAKEAIEAYEWEENG